MHHYLILLHGLRIKGADLFVEGSSKIAKALKIPSLIIGLTLVSMGTSAPEASVSINASLNNLKDLSVGNVVGSNIFNILGILGITALVCPIPIDRKNMWFEIPLCIIVSILLLLIAMNFFDRAVFGDRVVHGGVEIKREVFFLACRFK